MNELTGVSSVSTGCGGGGRETGDAVKGLAAAIFVSCAMAWCCGSWKRSDDDAAGYGDGTAYDGYLVEFVAAVVVAQSGSAGARTGGPNDVDIADDSIRTSAAGGSSAGASTTATATTATGSAPKRLHQSLGARRHSTQVIQLSFPSIILFFPTKRPPE